MATVDFKNPFISSYLTQTTVNPMSPKRESTPAVAAAGVNVPFDPANFVNVVKRVGALEGSTSVPEELVPYEIPEVESQQKVTQLGTQGALPYFTQPESQTANKFNKLVARNAYPVASEFAEYKENRGLNFIS